jgi:quinol monooxygenase YgiN
MIIIIEGTFRVPDLAAARPVMATMVSASRVEDGCISYAFSSDLLDPNLIHVAERWESREQLAVHAATDHMTTWRAAAAELGVSDRSLRIYEADPQDL